MTADLSRVNQWVWERLYEDGILNAGVGGRIYIDMAPQGATTPLVLIAYLGGADKALGRSNRFTNALYLIRAVAQGSSYDTIEPLADRIDERLTVPDVGVLVRDIRITSASREQPHQRKDAENGKPHVYLGGFYRIRYQPES